MKTSIEGTEMNTAATKVEKAVESKLIDWADWWELRGEENLDAPASLVDIEPVYGK